LRARHFRGAIHGEQVIVALGYFRQRLGRPLTIVWDRLSAHKAKEVSAFLAAHPHDYQVEWLPAYAPDLNPEELCNGAVKQDMLNTVPDSVDALLHQARCSFNRLGRRSAVLRSFFHHVRLDVT
jgi:transposase